MAPKTARPPSATRTDRRRAALQRRRRQATARSAAARRAVRRRRRLQGLAGVAVMAAVAGTVISLSAQDDDAPSRELRADRVAGATGPLAVSTVPTSYRAVFRAEAYEGSKVTISTEEVSVQRPFDGRVVIREGKPPGDAVQFEGRSAFGVYANYTGSGPAQVAGDAPTVALGDLRLASSLDALVAQGLFVLGERRRVLLPARGAAPAQGRECQVYRTGSPLQSLKIKAPTGTDYVDACIDGTGLMMEEVAIVGGKLTQRLTATALELDVQLDPAGFTIEGQRVGADQGGAEVTEVDRLVAPAPGYWALDAVPDGFTHRGRYLVQGQAASHVDVYVRGTDIITVRQGASGAEPDLSDAGPGRDVDLGPLGAAKVVLRTVGSTVIAHPGAEAFVHVAGTLAPAEVQAVASALRRG